MASWISGWLLTYFVHSTILLGLVAGLARLASDERSRERLWRIALLGPLLSTTIQTSAHGWFGSFLSPGGAFGRLGMGTRHVLLAGEGGDASGATLVGLGVTAWGLVVLLGLGLLVAGHVRLARLLRERRAVSSHSLGHRLPVSNLSIARGIRTPIALLSGEVCLPVQAVEQLTQDELSAIIAHEQEHVRRRDPLWLLLTAVICRVCFFQPLNWVAARRLRALAEFLCDSTAVEETSPLAVASALASVSSWVGRQRLAAIGMASAESLTLRRVQRILHGAPAAARPVRTVPVFGAILAGLILFGPAVGLGISAPSIRYTISAHDDAGPFSVSIERGKVVAVTLDGVPVAGSDIRQEGRVVWVSPDYALPLELTLTAGGGMQWTSRPRSISLH